MPNFFRESYARYGCTCGDDCKGDRRKGLWSSIYFRSEREIFCTDIRDSRGVLGHDVSRNRQQASNASNFLGYSHRLHRLLHIHQRKFHYKSRVVTYREPLEGSSMPQLLP
jgi:hypothetical protein